MVFNLLKAEWVLSGLESTTVAARVSSNPQETGASQKRSSLPKEKQIKLPLSAFFLLIKFTMIYTAHRLYWQHSGAYMRVEWVLVGRW